MKYEESTPSQDLTTLKNILVGREIADIRETVSTSLAKMSDEIAAIKSETLSAIANLRSDIESELKSIHQIFDEEKRNRSADLAAAQYQITSIQEKFASEVSAVQEMLGKDIETLADEMADHFASVETHIEQNERENASKNVRNEQLVSFLTNFAMTLSGNTTPVQASYAPPSYAPPPPPVAAYTPPVSESQPVPRPAPVSAHLFSHDTHHAMPSGDELMSNLDDIFDLNAAR